MTQWWQKLTKRYISRSRKLPTKLEPLICMWTYTWLIGWLFNGKIQYLRPQSIGSPIGKYTIWSISWEIDMNTEEGVAILWEHKKLMLYQGALHHHHILAGKLEDVLWFVVPMAHWVAAMNGCHQDAWHQGQQWMLHILQDQFGEPA